jgi:predicted nucleic acid-binding Zn ribbon protein
MLFARWADVVGESVAAHAQPVALVDGTLKVVVDDAAWATQLKFLTTEIARRCEEATGDAAVRRVEVRVKR